MSTGIVGPKVGIFTTLFLNFQILAQEFHKYSHMIKGTTTTTTIDERKGNDE